MSPKDHVAVRLDSETLGRLDALKEVLSTPWHEATRSDLLRAVILAGLDRMEAEHRASKGAKKAKVAKVAKVKKGAKARGR